MADDRGWYIVTYTIPGEKRTKKRRLRNHTEIAEVSATYPKGTKVWVMVPSLNIGYGMTVYGDGLMY